MRLYSEKDLKDYTFLVEKYTQMVDRCEKYINGNQGVVLENTIESKFYLSLMKTTKELMDALGVDVPDDKAKEIGFTMERVS